MLSMVDHASPHVLSQKLHSFHTRRQEAGEAHQTRLYRAEECISTHGVHLWMPLLKGIHDHHFRVEIAAEVWVEHGVLTLRDDRAPRVDEHGTHSVVPAPRRHEGLLTDDHTELLILVGRRLGAHAGKSSFQVL